MNYLCIIIRSASASADSNWYRAVWLSMQRGTVQLGKGGAALTPILRCRHSTVLTYHEYSTVHYSTISTEHPFNKIGTSAVVDTLAVFSPHMDSRASSDGLQSIQICSSPEFTHSALLLCNGSRATHCIASWQKEMGQLLQEMHPLLFLRLGSKKLEQLAPSPDQKSHAQCTLSAGLLSNNLPDVTSWWNFFKPQAQLCAKTSQWYPLHCPLLVILISERTNSVLVFNKLFHVFFDRREAKSIWISSFSP